MSAKGVESSPRHWVSSVRFSPIEMTTYGPEALASDTHFLLGLLHTPRREDPMYLAHPGVARTRHRRHQRRPHLDRDRAVRRHEGKRHRPQTGARSTAVEEFLEVRYL